MIEASDSQIPEIALEYGKQLEFKGEYAQALSMYQESQRALNAASYQGNTADVSRLQPGVIGGLAR